MPASSQPGLGRRPLLFGHHPVTYESAATTEAGPSFDIDRPTAIGLQRLYEQTPGVFFHHSGHTHRNKRTFLLDSEQNPVQSVEFLEVGATKEYPGGYSLLRLYTGGYVVSYYKNRTPLALAWAQRTPRRVLQPLPPLHAGHHRRPQPHGRPRPVRPPLAELTGRRGWPD
jgi:Icc protein